MSKILEPKTLAELQAMHTGSLMSRRKALLKCKESAEPSDQIGGVSTGAIEFKNTPAWQRAYDELKQVLLQREHIPNKQERKAARQAAAKRKK